MTRALSFLVRNWPLKIAALALASLLYAGLVLSQNAQVWPGSVPIVPVKLPASAVLLGNLGDVTEIRYFAPVDVASGLSSSSFSATVDLSQVTVQPGSPGATVKVDVQVADKRVQILDFKPHLINVQLDPLITKVVPVHVDRGEIPPGLQVRDPVLSSTEVTVSGPESIVRQVTAARARVVIQPSGVSVDQDVDIVAVDALGEVQRPVSMEPSSIHVQIKVFSELQSKSLPVNVAVTGTPGSGFEVESVEVSPAIVSVEGDADALANLAKIDTVPLSLSGITTDVAQTVGFALPEGIDTLGTSTVRVTVHLRALSGTRTVDAGIVLRGARDDRTYALSTDRVLVTIGGAIADLDRIDPRTFTASIDVTGLGTGSHAVAVDVNLPGGLSLVVVNPGRITVTVDVPATPTPSPTPVPTAGP